MDLPAEKTAELARLFYRELAKIQANAALPPLAKAEAACQLLDLIFQEACRSEKIIFTTAFARIAFACHKFQVEKKTQYWVHFFRKKLRNPFDNADPLNLSTAKPGGGKSTSKDGAPKPEDLCALGYRVVSDCIAALFGAAPPEEVQAFLSKRIPFTFVEVSVNAFKKKARVIALKDDEENDRLLAQDEANPSQLIYVQYNIADRNEPFSPTIRQIRSTFGFPVTLNLLDVEIVSEPFITQFPTTIYRPRAIVVEPDYLLDVSAVSECFQGFGAEPVLYLLKKFLPAEQTLPMMLGNIANFFLDELMNNPQASFSETFPKVFKINPLAFALLPDASIRELHSNSQKHWTTLKNMVLDGMKKAGIEPSDCYLEPSFYAETYGLQGRLDVFLKNENKSAIMELKSGRPFMPNRYGIGASHFIQTLVYDLMVRSVFGDEVEPASYILYSGLETSQLRYAPPVKAEQNEALQVRNQLVAIDRRLADLQGKFGEAPILERVTSNRFPQLKGFHQRDIELFEKTYSSLDDLEKRYFNAFTGFIAREHQLAKTGIHGVENANGLASLWLDTPEEKEANFKIIKSLKIKANHASQEEPLIHFEKTDGTNPLANFRPGDIAVLYPVGTPTSNLKPKASPLTSQIFKVTILAITPQAVTVRLRCKQFNLTIFGEHEFWNLEHDQMDMNFTAMYQGLFRFAQCPAAKRQLLLTTVPPAPPNPEWESTLQAEAPLPTTNCQLPTELTEEQALILEKMLAAPDYFLLWGPPGTGKTSQMLKHFAKWIFENTDENLLLLAYTNRAVDEICEALDRLGDGVKESYLRIGSQYSSGEQFENQLLGKKIGAVTKRAELLKILGQHRIFVSTLASLSNNLALLKLKKFRRVVIDEASQILEPALVGLLPQFEQFILVGDHKQLPAVVVQDTTASAVEDEALQGIGLYNLRNSLFERLYRRCLSQNWHWAYAHLSHQGRMHQDIMHFPNVHFYEGKLKILPQNIPAALHQQQELELQAVDFQFDWEQIVGRKRLVFLSTDVDPESPSRKTNRHEAALVAALVRYFQNGNGLPPSHKVEPKMNGRSIGIITPFRAQIAQIQEVLQRENIDCNGLTIDTVERYQGGARDVILISLCTNAAAQLDSLVSLSEEGVDRKLNVALTRARENVVILGNEGVLAQNEVYRKLIEHCRA